jgi:hypothetical protein
MLIHQVDLVLTSISAYNVDIMHYKSAEMMATITYVNIMWKYWKACSIAATNIWITVATGGARIAHSTSFWLEHTSCRAQLSSILEIKYTPTFIHLVSSSTTFLSHPTPPHLALLFLVLSTRSTSHLLQTTVACCTHRLQCFPPWL